MEAAPGPGDLQQGRHDDAAEGLRANVVRILDGLEVRGTPAGA